MRTGLNYPWNQARAVAHRLMAAARRIAEQADFQVGRVILLLRTGTWVLAPPGHGETKHVTVRRLDCDELKT